MDLEYLSNLLNILGKRVSESLCKVQTSHDNF